VAGPAEAQHLPGTDEALQHHDDYEAETLVTPTANAGARLDRLPIPRFHHRILWLIGGGMFLDSFDIYLDGGVLSELARSGWSNI
jgi:hypothetical protein